MGVGVARAVEDEEEDGSWLTLTGNPDVRRAPPVGTLTARPLDALGAGAGIQGGTVATDAPVACCLAGLAGT